MTQALNTTSPWKVKSQESLCQCCLGKDLLKNMSDPNELLDGNKNPFHILSECYSIDITSKNEHQNDPPQICESCVSRLNDAYIFRTEIKNSQNYFVNILQGTEAQQSCDDIKLEFEEDETKFISYWTEQIFNEEETILNDAETSKERHLIERDGINQKRASTDRASTDEDEGRSTHHREHPYSPITLTDDIENDLVAETDAIKNDLVMETVETEVIKDTPCIINVSKTVDTNVKKSITDIYKIKRNYCFYCETLVLNFERHIKRHHGSETAVRKILSLPVKSKRRKLLYASLRKKGNYLQVIGTNQSFQNFKPMKMTKKHSQDDYLPCTYCLGFYMKKRLWMHRKSCFENTNGGSNGNAQAEGQNIMIKHLNIDPKLRDLVFPRMRADKISLTAKQDPLICAYGAQYLKNHNLKYVVSVTSRKMRELAKILIEIKKIKPEIKNLSSALQPKYYDVIVESVKIISKYSPDTDEFKSPSFAMNISTTLKQCCNLALTFLSKRQGPLSTADITDSQTNINTFIQRLEANWQYDITNQASNDFHMNKWNKMTLIPLASDLKLLKDHLLATAAQASNELISNNKSLQAYTTLLETIYCRIVLLNRQRSVELQRLMLHSYQQHTEENDKYEQLDRGLSLAESKLLNSFKRVVIRGKRGKRSPILLTSEMCEDINLIITCRPAIINMNNPYLFGMPGVNTTICGCKVLLKYANNCRAKYPRAITSTKLRKYLSKLTQILNMSDNDIEQLVYCMGHTLVHTESHPLFDDVYQTAKISKLFLLMEEGKADKYKGQSLDDIELVLGANLLEECENNDDDNDSLSDRENIQNLTPETITPSPSNIEIQKVSKRQLVPWTDNQKELANVFFKRHIINKQAPKKFECDELIAKHPNIFNNKNWLKIKVYIQNVYTKSKIK